MQLTYKQLIKQGGWDLLITHEMKCHFYKDDLLIIGDKKGQEILHSESLSVKEGSFKSHSSFFIPVSDTPSPGSKIVRVGQHRIYLGAELYARHKDGRLFKHFARTGMIDIASRKSFKQDQNGRIQR